MKSIKAVGEQGRSLTLGLWEPCFWEMVSLARGKGAIGNLGRQLDKALDAPSKNWGLVCTVTASV